MPLEGNHNADVAFSETEFDTPAVGIYLIFVFGLLFSQLFQDLVRQQHALLVLEALKDTNRCDVYPTEVENKTT